MPRYIVERSFADVLDIPAGSDGQRLLRAIVACNSDRDVTWLHSFVSKDKRTTYCVYDGPNPEAIRLTAMSNGLPVDRIVEVSVLDPFAFHTL